jgi:hypothetical protein
MKTFGGIDAESAVDALNAVTNPFRGQKWELLQEGPVRFQAAIDVQISYDNGSGYDDTRWILMKVIFSKTGDPVGRITYSGQSERVRRWAWNDILPEWVYENVRDAIDLLRSENPSIPF